PKCAPSFQLQTGEGASSGPRPYSPAPPGRGSTGACPAVTSRGRGVPAAGTTATAKPFWPHRWERMGEGRNLGAWTAGFLPQVLLTPAWRKRPRSRHKPAARAAPPAAPQVSRASVGE
ncbi:hypothetical protein P7K49_002124, partial [Saguinus oedipus]